MVDDTTSSTAPADDGTVILVSPKGEEVESRNAVTINNLVYGHGYRAKGNDDPEAAVKATALEAGEKSETAEHADATGAQTEVSAAPAPTPKASAGTPKSSGKPVAGAPSTT